MNIVRVEVDRFDIKLAEPLSISFHTSYYEETFLVRLYADNGLVGWGEGVPFAPITGDSEEEALKEAAALRLGRIPPLESTDQFFERFVGGFRSHTLQAAFDMAAHDLVARARNIPVYQLYDKAPRLVPNSVTVYIKDTPEQTGENARRVFSAYPHLKLLKIKLKGQKDLERCQAVKEVAPAGMKFVLDANQGFADPVEGSRVLNQIIGVLGDVVAIEEPCPKGQHDRMKYVAEHVQGAKILADESCCDERDVVEIIRHRSAHGINIKLQKAGGITPAKRMARIAKEAGLAVMVGCMFEGALSTAAGVHFAVTTPNVMLTDLDMDLDQPLYWRGACRFENGSRIPLDEPGFAFALNEEHLRQLPEGEVRREHIATIQ